MGNKWVLLAASLLILLSSLMLVSLDDKQFSEAATGETLMDKAEKEGNVCEFNGLKWYFLLNEGKAELVGWDGIPIVGALYIPEKVFKTNGEGPEYYSVTKISDFMNSKTPLARSEINYIYIPKSVEIIGNQAFTNIRTLEEVVFEEGSILSTISGQAFEASGYDPTYIKEFEKTSDNFYLGGYGETLFYIDPNEGSSNSKKAFVSSGDVFKYIILAKGNWSESTVEKGFVQNSRFGLADYTENGMRLSLVELDGEIYTKITIEVELKEDNKMVRPQLTFSRADGQKITSYITIKKDTSINQPKVESTHSGNYDFSLSHKGFFSITIPDSVQVIGKEAFGDRGGLTTLKKIVIGEKSQLRVIGDNALPDVIGEVFIPSSIKSIGKNAINPQAKIIIGGGDASYQFDDQGALLSADGTTLIGYYGQNVQYSFSESIKVVKANAFSGSCLEKVTIRDGIEWGLFPFLNTPLKEVVFTEDLKQIPDYLLGGTKLQKIIIPSTVERIGVKSFYNIGNLKEVEFEAGSRISEIGDYAFMSNPALESVVFKAHSEGISCEIGEGAFYGCNKLSSITVDPSFSLKTIGKGAFSKDDGVSDRIDLSPVMMNSKEGIVIPSSVESIEVGAFSIVSSTSPTTLTEWDPGYGMFNTGTKFRGFLKADDYSISFADESKVYSIGDCAFQGYYGLSEVDLSNCIMLKTIGSESFSLSYIIKKEETPRLKNSITIRLPDCLESVGSKAFYRDGIGNVQISDVLVNELVIPSKVTHIGNSAFQYVAKKISFQEGSLIKDVGEIITENAPNIDNKDLYLLDLSNCLLLESVQIMVKTELPVGVYRIESRLGFDVQIVEKVINNEELYVPWDPIKNIANVVLLYSEEGKIVNIDSDDTTLNKCLLDGDYAISVEPSNDRFKMIDGMLVHLDGDDTVVVGIDSSQSDLTITDESGITAISDYSFKNSGLDSLRVVSDIDVGNHILYGTDSVDLFIMKDPSSISDTSLDGSRNLSVFIGHGVNPGIRSMIPSSSTIYNDILEEDKAVYLPEMVGELSVGDIGSCIIEGDVLTIDGMTFSDGYSLYDVSIHEDLLHSIVDHDTLEISLTSSETIIRMDVKDRAVGPFVQIILDGNGGTSDGSQWAYAYIPAGMTIVDSDMPSFTWSGYVFDVWKDNNGDVWNGFDDPLDKDLYLIAAWNSRAPIVFIDTEAGYIKQDSDRDGSIETENGDDVTLSFIAYPGFQLGNWILDGEDTGESAYDPYVIESIGRDQRISVSYTYSSPSSGLDSTVNIDLPSTDELNNLVKVAEMGGYLDTSGAVWTGHSSVPLIVNDSIFFRCGSNLYKAESDTGYIVKSQKSDSVQAYYHYLGYGDGLIVDYATGKIYDTDLNLVCDTPTTGALEFYGGWFYTSGSIVKKFSSESCWEANGGTVSVQTLGTMENVYSSYSGSRSVFVDGYMYRVYADKTERGIVGMDLKTGNTASIKLISLESRFMDDGWLSYSDGTLYLTGYIQGLFGAVACSGFNVLAYVNVNGLSFGTEGSYILNGETSFMSEFIVYDNLGFVNSGGNFYVFNIGGSGNVGEIRQVSVKGSPIKTAFSHGSMVMNTKDVSDGLLYFHVIPYQTESVTMSMVQYSLEEGAGFGTYTSKLPQNYNSQAVRSDVDGRMIWYNDSGHIYTYTTPEKNVYYFLIQDGSSARWYESHGATAADALAALGRSVVTLNSIDGLATVNGKAVSEEWSINVLADTSDKTKAGIIGQYKWVELDNLYSNAHDTDHYYIITDSSTLPTSSTTFTYAVEEGLRTYAFADNIGDRGIIGKELIRAEEEKTVTIRFYDGDKQFIDSVLIGEKGSKVSGSFPSVYKYGMIAEWKNASGKVVSLPVTSDIDQKYYLSWAIAPATYKIELNPDTTDKTRVTFSLEMTRDFGLEDLSDANLYVIGYYDGSDGKRFISTISKIVIENMKATSVVSLSSDDLVDVSFRIIRGSISDTSYNNYGSAYWSGGEGA